MNRRQIFDMLEEESDVEMIGHGQFESAGQVYYEISVVVDRDLEQFADRLREEIEKYHGEWQVQEYPDWTGPVGWDHETEEEIETNLRVKKNLYNEHMI